MKIWESDGVIGALCVLHETRLSDSKRTGTYAVSVTALRSAAVSYWFRGTLLGRGSEKMVLVFACCIVVHNVSVRTILGQA